MKIGIVPARFQCSYLHDAHIKLVLHACKENDHVIVLLGDAPTRLTTDNPLPYEVRKQMVLDMFKVEVLPMPDFKYDEVWSKELDKFIDNFYPNDQVTLYGSRQSFISSYHGKYKTEMVESIIIEGLSASCLREQIHKTPKNSIDWREGIIYASAYKYPTSYQTVDIAILNSSKTQILLGKKEFEKKYRFIGGIVDSNLDDSLEIAAKRETLEEIGRVETGDYKYISSHRVDDWRYKKSKDKIMTAFFCCTYVFGRCEPKDDISEIKWFNLVSLTEEDFEPEHIILFKSLKQFLNKK